MKKNVFIGLMVIFCFGMLSNGISQKSTVVLKSQMDTVSYIIGSNIGSNFNQNGLEINTDILFKGISEAMKGYQPLFNDSIVKAVMTNFQKNMMSKQDNKRKVEAEKNKKAGEAFLAENKKKKDVVTLPSGLQYRIITKGTGPMPKETDKVSVNYEGKLLDGKVFDSSYERKEPASFPVNQVIKGWTEALLIMPVGSTWELFIPSNIAYGERETGSIPAGATLTFKVELLSIEKKDEKKADDKKSEEKKDVKKEEKKK